MASRGNSAAPAWHAHLPEPQTVLETWKELSGEWGALEAAVDAMSGRERSGEHSEKQQREALLRVHQKLVELGASRGTPYPLAFAAYMLHAGSRSGAAAAAACPPAHACCLPELAWARLAWGRVLNALACPAAGRLRPRHRPPRLPRRRTRALPRLQAGG